MKIVTILGTRPEIIRLSAVIGRLDTTAGIEHQLVHTGQNYDYELNEIFFEDLGIRRPDHFLNAADTTLGGTYGAILAGSEQVLRAELPQAVLILGDTNSAIAAIMAKRLHVPIFHMEAGNRSFDANVPEEVNRKIVDHIADFNLVYTEHARRNLLREGIEPRRIYLTGSPMAEVLAEQRPKIEASTATADLSLTPGQFFLVSAHREENVDHPKRLAALLQSLRALHSEFGDPIVVSLHPRTRNRLANSAELEGVQFHAPFGFSDYCRLQIDAMCVLSDSGTIAEEAAMLGFSAVTIRDSIERPEALDAGVITMCGLEETDVIRAVKNAIDCQPSSVPAGYQILDTSQRVVKLILGLTGRSASWSGLHPE